VSWNCIQAVRPVREAHLELLVLIDVQSFTTLSLATPPPLAAAAVIAAGLTATASILLGRVGVLLFLLALLEFVKLWGSRGRRGGRP
jgi:hypothetical protein